MTTEPSDSPQTTDQHKPLGFLELVKSVSMAFLGVQSNNTRERDFSRGKLSHFIIIGLVLGLIFILIIVGVVSLVMNLATG